MPLLYRNDGQSLHTLKVPAIIGEQRQPIMEGRGTYQCVEVSDDSSCRPQPASFTCEYLANTVVQVQKVDSIQEILKRLLVFPRR